MAPRRRKERNASDIGLSQPDRSAPSDQTLLQLAQERGLFEQASKQARRKSRELRTESSEDEDDESGFSPTAQRIAEAIMWSISLAMLHFTLDLFVQHQYAISIQWPKILARSGQAFLVFVILMYALHPHPSNSTLLPGLPARFQYPLRQALFFITSVGAGCYMIYITNKHGYLAVMKRAPTLGCLWVWSVIELNLGLAVASLACAGFFLWHGGYDIK